MSVNLSKQTIQDIASEYLRGRTVDEISIDSGIGRNNVKRALAEAELIKLSWYKTTEEDLILNFLEDKGITTVQDLKNATNIWKSYQV